MGARRTTFDKLQRERAKKAKASMKREARQMRGARGDGDDGGGEGHSGEQMSEAALLERMAQIHAAFDEGTMSFEEFEEQKLDVISRLAAL